MVYPEKMIVSSPPSFPALVGGQEMVKVVAHGQACRGDCARGAGGGGVRVSVSERMIAKGPNTGTGKGKEKGQRGCIRAYLVVRYGKLVYG